MNFLFIFILFIFSCDESNPLVVQGDLDNLPILNTLGNSWTYNFELSFDGVSILAEPHNFMREVINSDAIDFDFTSDCNLSEDIIYILSTALTPLDYEDEGLGNGLEFECEEYIPSDMCQLELPPTYPIIYTIHTDSPDFFQYCDTIYEEEEVEDDGGPDAVSRVPTNPYNVFNIINIEYPLHIGKIWELTNNYFVSTYEVISEEIVPLNISGNTIHMNTYKISYTNNFITDTYFYVSNIGVVKIESVFTGTSTYETFPDGTGEVLEVSTNIELLDYNLID